MFFQVQGDPHPWPQNAKTPASSCALVIVDMQNDYCTPGFYIDQAGYDTQRLRAPIAKIQQVVKVARRGGFQVIYTRHGRVPGTGPSTIPLPFPKTSARGEPGWQIVPELLPGPMDEIIEKTTCSAFFSGELDRLLRQKGIRHLALCGNTIDVCVHSTLRAAVDLDYECLLLSDCCGALHEALHTWAVESVKIENGVFGTVADAEAFVKALNLAGG